MSLTRRITLFVTALAILAVGCGTAVEPSEKLNATSENLDGGGSTGSTGFSSSGGHGSTGAGGTTGGSTNIFAYSQAAYVKASNTEASDSFATTAVSENGATLAVGAPGEDSNAIGVNGAQTDNSMSGSGAVYVYTKAAGAWSQQAYIKASNAGMFDAFGTAVALSADGNTLAVGAPGERSNATGIDHNQNDDSAPNSGAVYVFTRSGSTWTQQAYIKASNTEAADLFGQQIALSGDGRTLAVSAVGEDSAAVGVNGNQTDNSASASGAVYVFFRATTSWAQIAYLKASNTGASDAFGSALTIASQGALLAVGAPRESSANGDPSNDAAPWSGAVYVFATSGSTWSQDAYLKAPTIDVSDSFGYSVSLSGDGLALAVGAPSESSSATGIDGDRTNNTAPDAGAVFLFAKSGGSWSFTNYIKASNTNEGDGFGATVALPSASLLAVGAPGEASNATGVNGNWSNNSAAQSGAVYVFDYNFISWKQTNYIKASNTAASDGFGFFLSFSADRGTLAVGAANEDSNATGINGSQTNDLAGDSGAVYLFTR